MSAINIKVRITVDPAGRVLVWEHERTLPSDRVVTNDGTGNYEQDVSGSWQGQPGCVEHVLDVTLPLPPLLAPIVRVIPNSDRCGDLHGRIVNLGPQEKP